MTMDEESKKVFQEAMKDVTPIKKKDNKVYPATKKKKISPPAKRHDSSQSSSTFLNLPPVSAEQVIGRNKTDIGYHAYLDLQSGQMHSQARLDLHHSNAEQAVQKLNAFFQECDKRQVKYCLIIHGKGSGIIKAVVQHYIECSAKVAAYHSARQQDGGTGAVYVMML